MLTDLLIRNYRVFKELRIDQLARVNLIVGANNSGKSSLLEAICMLMGRGTARSLFDPLEARGEIALVDREEARQSTSRSILYEVAHLFHGHQLNPECTIEISSPSDNQHRFRLAFEKDWRPHRSPEAGDELSDTEPLSAALSVSYQGEIYAVYELDEQGLCSGRSRLPRPRPDILPAVRLVTTEPLAYGLLAMLWDTITLTPKEDKVVEALRILEPKARRIGFTSRPKGILLQIEGENAPVPLGNMGDGMRRILAYTASLVSAENGVVLVDEIDTGLHYSVQTDMWRLVLETAEALNVQVFATTHSWDCIEAFQEAMAEEGWPERGQLLRVSRDGDATRAVLYSGEELAIATAQEIEVR